MANQPPRSPQGRPPQGPRRRSPQVRPGRPSGSPRPVSRQPDGKMPARQLPTSQPRHHDSRPNGRLLYLIGAIVLGVLGLKFLLQRMPSGELGESANTGGSLIPKILTPKAPEPPPFQPLAVDESNVDPAVQAVVDNYVSQLGGVGFDQAQQGVWVQRGDRLLAQHEGKTRLPAASLTKLATTLLSVDRWEPDYKFITRIGVNGPVENGVVKGDLVVVGGGDPLFVWESAIAIGNSLNQLGITRVEGNLIVGGVFVMNFERDRPYAGNLFREGMDSANWSWPPAEQFKTFPEGTPQPQVTITGQTLIVESVEPASVEILAEHHSLPMQELLKRMNMYSNNIMAELLADLLGGAPALAEKTVALTGVGPDEVQFINGSGLGQENQTSPRTSCRMLDVIGQKLEPHGLGLKDVLPIVPEDKGTLEDRRLPSGLIGKTGTLSDVSNLAGMLPVAGQPVMYLDQPDAVCFAVQNRGTDLNYFYDQQEVVIGEFKRVTEGQGQNTVSLRPLSPPALPQAASQNP